MNSTIPRAQYIILVAVEAEEIALQAEAHSLGLTCDEVEGRFGKYYDLHNVGGSRVLAARTEMGPFSYEGSASKAIYFKNEADATGIICLGMAYDVHLPSIQNRLSQGLCQNCRPHSL